MSLTKRQLKSFRDDGFLIIRRLYGRDEIDQLSTWIDELAARTPRWGEDMFYYEDDGKKPGGRILSRIEKFADHHEGLRAFINDPGLTAAVSELLGERPVLFKEKINFKVPGGDGFKPHQDIQPGWDSYAPYFISVLITVDKSTLGNGCLELARGHHRRGLIGRPWTPLEGKELEGIDFIACPMDAGDVTFFDCFCPHQSKENPTNRPRRNLYLTFNRASDGDHRERYFADKRQSYPPDNEREPGKTYRFRV